MINFHGNRFWFCLVWFPAPLLLFPTRNVVPKIVPRLHAMLRFGLGLSRGRIVFKSSITQLCGSHHCRAVVSSSSSVFLDCNSRTSSRFLREFGARRTWDCEPYRCSKFYQRTLHSTLQISRCNFGLPLVREAATTSMDYTSQANAGLAKSLWIGSRREAFAALYHPFMVSLAAGTLSKTSFQHYIAQDVYFLETFKKAYQMAKDSTENVEAKTIIDALEQAVNDELAMHSSLVESWGFNPEDPSYVVLNPATKAYCDFLLATARQGEQNAHQNEHSTGFGGTTARIIAAMTPCMRLYAFLGQEIKRYVKQVLDHPYRQWIDAYSSPDFEAAASKIEQLLDKLTATSQGESERVVLQMLYSKAMTLEVEFFSAQPLRPGAIPFFKCEAASQQKLLLVSDFDSTCTIADSCPVLADLTVQNVGKSHSNRSLREVEANALRKQWDSLVMEYMDKYAQVLEDNLPVQQEEPGNAHIRGELRELLEKMSEFEQKANARIEEAAVLKGLSLSDIRASGSSMPLRKGCATFLNRLSSEDVHVDVHVISVCWSKTFIEGAFETGGLCIPNIQANELSFDGDVSTGKIIRNVETGLDKDRHFVQILDTLKKNPEELAENVVEDVRSVYIGDSLTDLLCLLRADVGIVLGDSSTLRQVYGRGLSPLYLKALHEAQAKMKGDKKLGNSSGLVYMVSSWYEVEAFLLGPASSNLGTM